VTTAGAPRKSPERLLKLSRIGDPGSSNVRGRPRLRSPLGGPDSVLNAAPTGPPGLPVRLRATLRTIKALTSVRLPPRSVCSRREAPVARTALPTPSCCIAGRRAACADGLGTDRRCKASFTRGAPSHHLARGTEPGTCYDGPECARYRSRSKGQCSSYRPSAVARRPRVVIGRAVRLYRPYLGSQTIFSRRVSPARSSTLARSADCSANAARERRNDLHNVKQHRHHSSSCRAPSCTRKPWSPVGPTWTSTGT
jgi:hypothetical protein